MIDGGSELETATKTDSDPLHIILVKAKGAGAYNVGPSPIRDYSHALRTDPHRSGFV